MAQASQPSADDIAYIRHLSESGARAPLIGGRFMAWWGFLLVVAYLGQHLAINGLIGDGRLIFGIIWGSFALLGLSGQLILARSIAGKPGQGSAGNLAMRSVWMMGALSIGAMVAGSAVISGEQTWRRLDLGLHRAGRLRGLCLRARTSPARSPVTGS